MTAHHGVRLTNGCETPSLPRRTKKDVMRRFKCLLLLVVSMLCLTSVGVQAEEDDSVTLNSGEILKGRITSLTDTDVTMEVTNERHTIFTTQIIARSDIKEVYKP